LPDKGTVLITVTSKEKKDILGVAQYLKEAGFNILATEGTHKFFEENGVESTFIKKVHEGRPNIVDAIHNKEIQLIINTPIGKSSMYDDSYIRKAAIKHKVPYITTASAAKAAAEGIKAYIKQKTGTEVKSLQMYHKEIT
jgi:carbamoyl-phosphate synthase large subunit